MKGAMCTEDGSKSLGAPVPASTVEHCIWAGYLVRDVRNPLQELRLHLLVHGRVVVIVFRSCACQLRGYCRRAGGLVNGVCDPLEELRIHLLVPGESALLALTGIGWAAIRGDPLHHCKREGHWGGGRFTQPDHSYVEGKVLRRNAAPS